MLRAAVRCRRRYWPGAPLRAYFPPERATDAAADIAFHHVRNEELRLRFQRRRERPARETPLREIFSRAFSSLAMTRISGDLPQPLGPTAPGTLRPEMGRLTSFRTGSSGFFRQAKCACCNSTALRLNDNRAMMRRQCLFHQNPWRRSPFQKKPAPGLAGAEEKPRFNAGRRVQPCRRPDICRPDRAPPPARA